MLSQRHRSPGSPWHMCSSWFELLSLVCESPAVEPSGQEGARALHEHRRGLGVGGTRLIPRSQLPSSLTDVPGRPGGPGSPGSPRLPGSPWVPGNPGSPLAPATKTGPTLRTGLLGSDLCSSTHNTRNLEFCASTSPPTTQGWHQSPSQGLVRKSKSIDRCDESS